VSLLCKAGGETIASGTIMFQLRPPSFNRPHNLFGYILNIYVRPEWRRRGAATAVMRALHEEARRRGAVRVGLHASSAGAAVYAGLGYVNKPGYMETDLEPAADKAASG
jgi:ribosomal protein S18 acetylase RimI-like enzyme